MAVFFSSCEKDKFSTVPQITYKSVKPNATSVDINSVIPDITFAITDSEGDLGFKANSDTSYIYLKNNLTGKFDSLLFPDLQTAGKANFQAEVTVSISSVLQCKSLPSGDLHTDTLTFDVYVTDFKKNKSNTITSEPVYFTCF